VLPRLKKQLAILSLNNYFLPKVSGGI